MILANFKILWQKNTNEYKKLLLNRIKKHFWKIPIWFGGYIHNWHYYGQIKDEKKYQGFYIKILEIPYMVFTGVMKHYGKMLPIIYIEKSLKNQKSQRTVS